MDNLPFTLNTIVPDTLNYICSFCELKTYSDLFYVSKQLRSLILILLKWIPFSEERDDLLLEAAASNGRIMFIECATSCGYYFSEWTISSAAQAGEIATVI